MDKETFLTRIRNVASRETSADPDGWSDENVLWGHCAVVALLAQDYFGGTLVRGSLENTKYAHLRSHYWNKLPDGDEVDFTSSQYSDLSIGDLQGEERPRERVLPYPDTLKRYEMLEERFEQSLETSPTHPSS
jgi:hypothetical protein